MAALPFRFTGDEPLLTPPSAPQAAPAVRELTVRALAVGLTIGAVLAAGNVYTGLKSSFIDGGALTAALLSFTFFATFRRFVRTPFGPFENNVAQTAAASAAVMTYVHGLMGPMPALMMMGHHHPPWALWVWGLALAIIGLGIGALLRHKLVVEDALPFPTGRATAELIKTVHTNQGEAARRTKILLLAALAAGTLTWFRDGRPALIPQAFYLPLTVGGLTAASLTLGVATSPLMAATGMFIGLRGSLSLLVGSAVGWALLAPAAAAGAWTKDHSYGSLTSWLVWPALGAMMAGTIVPMLIGWRTAGAAVARTWRDAHKLAARRPAADSTLSSRGAPERRGERAAGFGVVIVAVGALAWTGAHTFGFSPVVTIVVLLASVVLSGISARAAGETDVAPIGSMGSLTQILFGGGGSQTSVLAGAVASGTASAAAQVMWAFKAGHTLRASVRSQIVAHALGAVVGSLVVVPVYLLVTAAYPLGSERMPAAAAMSWKATADAITGGVGGLPIHGLHAAIGGFAVGALLSLLQRTRAGAFLPSSMAVGIGMIMPCSLAAAAVIGAGVLAVARRRSPSLANGEGDSLAAGMLAGESLIGVLIAALVSAGVLTF
ncbi:MAG: OPT/YSL family transporter [Pseudomonadota bacterium]